MKCKDCFTTNCNVRDNKSRDDSYCQHATSKHESFQSKLKEIVTDWEDNFEDIPSIDILVKLQELLKIESGGIKKSPLEKKLKG